MNEPQRSVEIKTAKRKPELEDINYDQLKKMKLDNSISNNNCWGIENMDDKIDDEAVTLTKEINHIVKMPRETSPILETIEEFSSHQDLINYDESMKEKNNDCEVSNDKKTTEGIKITCRKEANENCNNKVKGEVNCQKKEVAYRVSNIIKCICNTSKDNEDFLERNIVQDVRSRQTRIAMLKMREELHDLTFHDSHHAHEYFVVNPCKLFYSLTANKGEQNDSTIYQNLELPQALLPIGTEVIKQVLNDIKTFAVFPENVKSYDSFKAEVIQTQVFNWDDVDKICRFIKTKSEFGATLQELVVSIV